MNPDNKVYECARCAGELRDSRNAAVELWNETGKQLQKADDVLRSLSSYLGQGGMWDTENLDYDEVEARIREGIETVINIERQRAKTKGR